MPGVPPSTAPLALATCGAILPKREASRTPAQGSTGSGMRQRSGPTGGPGEGNAVEAQHAVARHALQLARGDLDICGYGLIHLGSCLAEWLCNHDPVAGRAAQGRENACGI